MHALLALASLGACFQDSEPKSFITPASEEPSSQTEDWAGSPIEVTVDCDGSGFSERNEPLEGTTALRIIGIYETDAPHHDEGEATVHVALDQPNVLLLNSYEPVHWVVTEEYPGSVVGVIANGYYDMRITAPDGAWTQVLTGGDRIGASSAYDWDDYDTRTLVLDAEVHTGLDLTSFHGCYHANDWLLEPGEGEVDTDQDGYDCADREEPPGPADLSLLSGLCPEVLAESYACLSMSGTDVVLAGLDTGNLCTVANLGLYAGSHGLTWLGDSVYTCTGHWGQLTRSSLVDGTVTPTHHYCSSVTAWNGGLLTLGNLSDADWGIHNCPSFHDAQCGRCSSMGYDIRDSRMTAYEDTLYTAWHSTEYITTVDILSGEELGDVEIEDFDTWVYGMSLIDDGLLVILERSSAIRVFDPVTGAALWEVPQQQSLDGLYCFDTSDVPSVGDDDDEEDPDDDDTTDDAVEDDDEPASTDTGLAGDKDEGRRCAALPGPAGLLPSLLALLGAAVVGRRRSAH
jgi:hypothetical protein